MNDLTQVMTINLLDSSRNTNNVKRVRLCNDNSRGQKMRTGNFWKNDSSLLNLNDLLITTNIKTIYISKKYNSLNTF